MRSFLVERTPEDVHEIVDLGLVGVPGHASARPERVSDRGDVAAELGDERADGREVRRAAGKADGVLAWQPVVTSCRVVLEDAAGCHGGEPLTDVALGEAGSVGELRAGHRLAGGRIEQARPPADLDEVGECAPGEEPEEPTGELFHRGFVDIGERGRGAVVAVDCGHATNVRNRVATVMGRAPQVLAVRSLRRPFRHGRASSRASWRTRPPWRGC